MYVAFVYEFFISNDCTESTVKYFNGYYISSSVGGGAVLIISLTPGPAYPHTPTVSSTQYISVLIFPQYCPNQSQLQASLVSIRKSPL